MARSPLRQGIVARDGNGLSVWDEYVKSHKGAANFRGKPFPFYDKLCTIFGKDRATGSKAIDLGEEDDVVPETQRSSPIDDFDFVEDHVQGGLSEMRNDKGGNLDYIQ
ncbi:hypothetical protein L6452_21728 [Arctium lappa]|uniref:Uncharacterized protein n=1 Tax=Arctium lappa TaxID=4217 RepID=A0ACB9AXG2_ARCLA|nr:hypothetical protein L6452_21728 [Arctium lappa]